jgi:hypothetical protein
VCSFEHTIRACVFYRTHTPAIVYTSRYLKPTGRINWNEEPVYRPFQLQKPLVFYDHTEAVGKISPLVSNIFLISFPAKVPGRKKGSTLKRFIKKRTGYAWRKKGRTF